MEDFDMIQRRREENRQRILKGFKTDIEKAQDDELEKARVARQVGDVNPNNPNLVWVQLPSGKFDWRKKDGMAHKRHNESQKNNASTGQKSLDEHAKDTDSSTLKKVADSPSVSPKLKEAAKKELKDRGESSSSKSNDNSPKVDRMEALRHLNNLKNKKGSINEVMQAVKEFNGGEFPESVSKYMSKRGQKNEDKLYSALATEMSKMPQSFLKKYSPSFVTDVDGKHTHAQSPAAISRQIDMDVDQMKSLLGTKDDHKIFSAIKNANRGILPDDVKRVQDALDSGNGEMDDKEVISILSKYMKEKDTTKSDSSKKKSDKDSSPKQSTEGKKSKVKWDDVERHLGSSSDHKIFNAIKQANDGKLPKEVQAVRNWIDSGGEDGDFDDEKAVKILKKYFS